MRTCHPCILPYDYILHLETFSEDLQYVFHKLNMPKDIFTVDVRKNIAFNVTKTKPNDSYFENIDPLVISELYGWIKEDFQLFGYEVPDFVLNAIV